jgi:hypothetical protein
MRFNILKTFLAGCVAFVEWPYSELFTAFKINYGVEQGCQMVCFQTKNYNLGKIWRALD